MFSKFLVASVTLSAVLSALASPTGYPPTTDGDSYAAPDVYTPNVDPTTDYPAPDVWVPDVDSPTADYPSTDSYDGADPVTGDYVDTYPIYGDDAPTNDNTDTPTTGDGNNGQCNTGTVQCCNTVQDAQSDSAQHAAEKGGIDISSITGLVGINCNPVSVFGAGGNSCSAQPTCCTGNNFSGVIVVGCSPINVNA